MTGVQTCALRSGDVLVRVCGHAVATIDDVLSQMLLTEPGARCALDLLRDGQAWQAEAVIGTRAAP